MENGFADIPSKEEIDSGKFALDVLRCLEREPGLVEASVVKALTKRDRNALAAWILRHTIRCRLTTDQMALLLDCASSTTLRKSFKALRKTINSEPGAKPKISLEQYPELLETAERLRPALLKFLAIPKTSRTLGETLSYLKKDHRRACEFLSRHIVHFQRALDDPKLRNRAKKSIKGRARVLAEAMAGSDYQLTFSTSREFLRKARLLSENKSS